MQSIVLKIAGFYIKIIFRPQLKLGRGFPKYSIFDSIFNRLKGFIVIPSKRNIDFTIEFFNHPPITFQKKINKLATAHLCEIFIMKSNSAISHLSISSDQFDALLTYVIQNLLSKHKGFMLHSSANRIGAEAVLFLGDNSSGKSTISQLLQPNFPILADDCVFIRKLRNDYYVYQNPYQEKQNNFYKGADAVKLGRIYFIQKSANTRLIQFDTHVKNKHTLLLKQIISERAFVGSFIQTVLRFANDFENIATLEFKKNKNDVLRFFLKDYGLQQKAVHVPGGLVH